MENTADEKIINQKYHLKPGSVYVTQTPSVITAVVGSGVGVCLYDTEMCYGGMNHYVLPYPDKSDEPTARFGTVAMYELYYSFVYFYSKKENLVARIIGGSCVESSGNSGKTAAENIFICRECLHKLGISVISEDTGGTAGRKVYYNTQNNEIIVALTGLKTGEKIYFPC